MCFLKHIKLCWVSFKVCLFVLILFSSVLFQIRGHPSRRGTYKDNVVGGFNRFGLDLF